MKKIFVLILILAGSFFAKSALAAEIKYYEFAPDLVSKSVSALDGNMYQHFKAYDDYVSAIDVWVDNIGSSGNADFYLQDSSGNVLASKSVSVPHINKIWGGQRLHVVFNQSVQVVSNSDYRIKISSSMPDFDIYYVPSVYLLGHNADYGIDKNIGLAYIGASQQNFAFKFALYEDNDVLKPIISNVSPKLIDQNTVAINFNANEPVDYRIDWGPTQSGSTQSTSYSDNYTQCNQDISTCSLNISVMPDTAYTYNLFVKDIWGNVNNFSGSFISSSVWFNQASSSQNSTAASSSSIALAISNVRIVSLTTNTISVAWTTNIPANSSMLIGLNQPGMRVVTSVGDATYELEHYLNSGSALIPNNSYYASIVSIDANKNYASQIINFDTNINQSSGQNSTTQNSTTQNNTQQNNNQVQNNTQTQTSSSQINVIDNLSSQQTQTNNSQSININYDNSSGPQNLNISWNSNYEPSNGYRIDIFSSDRKFIKTINVSSKINNIKVSGLAAGDYYAVVYKNDNGVFKKVDNPKNFPVSSSSQQASYFSKDILKNPIFYIFSVGILLIILSGSIIVIKKRKL